MVQYQRSLDRAFGALADPTRRAILARLGEGSATISELAQPSGMSLTGVKKHVLVLEEAALVRTEKRGRSRHCRLDPAGLERAGRWIEAHRRGWELRFERVEEVIERKRGEPR
jgi:DNA-binding transcriptional ArsR family regulator